MKVKIAVLLMVLTLALSFASADEISFNGGVSRMVLKNGKESVSLTGGASVKVGSLSIEADSMELTGSGWSTIRCSGKVEIVDEERDMTIRSSSLYYDRELDRILIPSYFEIEDRGNELSASASHLEFDMANETLVLSGRVRMNKIDGDDIVRIKAESISYDRNRERLEIRGGADVTYRGDTYQAELVVLDLENEEIRLDGNIRGSING